MITNIIPTNKYDILSSEFANKVGVSQQQANSVVEVNSVYADEGYILLMLSVYITNTVHDQESEFYTLLSNSNGLHYAILEQKVNRISTNRWEVVSLYRNEDIPCSPELTLSIRLYRRIVNSRNNVFELTPKLKGRNGKNLTEREVALSHETESSFASKITAFTFYLYPNTYNENDYRNDEVYKKLMNYDCLFNASVSVNCYTRNHIRVDQGYINKGVMLTLEAIEMSPYSVKALLYTPEYLSQIMSADVTIKGTHTAERAMNITDSTNGYITAEIYGFINNSYLQSKDKKIKIQVSRLYSIRKNEGGSGSMHIDGGDINLIGPWNFTLLGAKKPFEN